MSLRKLHLVEAEKAFAYFRGFFCLYKDANVGIGKIVSQLQDRICGDLNSMQQRPIRDAVAITGSLADDKLRVERFESFADNPLVVGPRFQRMNIKITLAAPVLWPASGVVVGIASPTYKERSISELNLVRTYHIDCLFGYATSTYMSDGKVGRRKTYRHITSGMLERFCNKLQATFHRHSMEFSGIHDSTSQEAYDMAKEGIVRPRAHTAIGIHSIRCIDLSLPKMTLEIQCTNEDADSLISFVNDIGDKLRSAACVERIRCVRFGPFTTEDALLKKNWNLQEILRNIQHCREKAELLRFPSLYNKESLKTSTLKVIDA